MKITNLLNVLFLGAVCAVAQSAQAAMIDVKGYAWSENIGWIKFNGTAQDGNSYGVKINTDNNTMSGYAWSENIGWISFDNAVNYGDATRQPAVSCSGSKCYLTGFARAISACKDNLWSNSKCTGTGAGDKAGGWDGWIDLDDSNDPSTKYQVYIDSATGDFYNWATGSDEASGVAGWISFNSKNCDTNGNGVMDAGDATVAGCPAAGATVAAYKVYITPLVQSVMACAGCPSDTGLVCDNSNPTASWLFYQPVVGNSCNSCNFTINNNSSGAILHSKWEIISKADNEVKYTVTYNDADALNPFIFQNSPALNGDYIVKLSVWNTDEALAAVSTRNITIKREAKAKIYCTMDVAGDPAVPVNWQECKDDFYKKVRKGSKVYVMDGGSEISEGAVRITSRELRFWTWSSGVRPAAPSVTENLASAGDYKSFTADKNNAIRLDVYDNNSPQRHNCKDTGNFPGKAIPQWWEVSPIGMILDNLIAGIYKFF